MTSEFKSHAMPFSNALTIINNQTSLAQDYRFSLEQNLPGACTLSDQLVITLNNDVNMSRMTPMAVLAYHAIKGVGRWDDSIEDAREVANTVLFQFIQNPFKWNGAEPLGYFFVRSVDWRGKDLIRKNHRHHDGRIQNWHNNDDGADESEPTANIQAPCSLTEHDYETMRRCVYDLVATFPDSQKLIATELILKVDGMTGVELAAVLNVAPGTVSGQLKKLRTMIADYIRELELGISA